jgi:hypothetical protein
MKTTNKPDHAEYSCPDRVRVLSVEMSDGGRRGYVCQVGHRLSTRSLLFAKEKELEKALWSAAVLMLHTLNVHEELLHEQKWSRETRVGLRRRVREATLQYRTLVRMIEHTHGTQ